MHGVDTRAVQIPRSARVVARSMCTEFSYNWAPHISTPWAIAKIRALFWRTRVAHGFGIPDARLGVLTLGFLPADETTARSSMALTAERRMAIEMCGGATTRNTVIAASL